MLDGDTTWIPPIFVLWAWHLLDATTWGLGIDPLPEWRCLAEQRQADRQALDEVRQWVEQLAPLPYALPVDTFCRALDQAHPRLRLGTMLAYMSAQTGNILADYAPGEYEHGRGEPPQWEWNSWARISMSADDARQINRHYRRLVQQVDQAPLPVLKRWTTLLREVVQCSALTSPSRSNRLIDILDNHSEVQPIDISAL